MTTDTAHPTIDDQIAVLEAEIVDLNRRWGPLARFHPVASQNRGPSYDPGPLFTKTEIGLQIDLTQQRFAGLQADRSRARLERLRREAGEISGVVAETLASWEETERVATAARLAHQNALADSKRTQGQILAEEREALRAEGDLRRWAAEAVKDEAILADLRPIVANRAQRVAQEVSA